MKYRKELSYVETYVIQSDGLDPITVYVTNYEPGKGKLVIECFSESWAYYWSAMGEKNLQEFVTGANNGYLVNKLCGKTSETDFDKLTKLVNDALDSDLYCFTNDVEVAMEYNAVCDALGDDWIHDIPQRPTREANYLDEIITVVKSAFNAEINEG